MKSLFKVMKNLPEPLRKTGQFLNLPPEIFQWVDDGKTIPKAKREKYERLLSAGGKIKGEDLDRLIENGHPDIIKPLSRRDLSKEESLKLLGVGSFKRGKTYARNEETKDLLRKIINNYVSHGHDAVNEVFATGNARAVGRIMANNPGNVTGEALQTIATRPINTGVLAQKVVDSPAFDHNVARLMAAHPNSDTASLAISNIIQKDPEHKDAFLSLVLQHPNPDVTSRVLGNSNVDFKPEHIGAMLRHSDERVSSQALGRIMTNDQRDYAMDTFFNDPSTFLKNSKTFLMQHSNPWKTDWRNRSRETEGDPPEVFTSDVMHKIIDKTIEYNKPELFDNSEFWARASGSYTEKMTSPDHFTSDHLSKLANSRWSAPTTTNGYKQGYDEGVNDLFDKVLSDENVTSDHLNDLMNNESFRDHMNVTNYGDNDKNGWVKKLAEHKKASPDLLKEVWTKAHKDESTKEKDSKSYYNRRSDIYSIFANNENTPQDVIHDMMDNYDHLTSNDTKARIAKHRNLDPTRIETFMAHEDPNIRIMASENPSATSDQITRGLKDPRKEVRNAWMQNPSLSDEHLRPLLKDKAQGNRIALAANEKMSGDLLHEMVTKDKSFKVREQAMKHENIKPETIAWMMMNDPHPSLRDKAVGHPKATPESIMNAFRVKPNAAIISSMLNRGNTEYTSDQYKEMVDASLEKAAELQAHKESLPFEESREFKTGSENFGWRQPPNPTHAYTMGKEFGKTRQNLAIIGGQDGNARKAILNHPASDEYIIMNMLQADRDSLEKVVGPEEIKSIYENQINNSSEVRSGLMSQIMKHPSFEASGLSQRMLTDNNPTAAKAMIDDFENLDEPTKLTVVDRLRGDDHENVKTLLGKADNKEIFDKLLQHPTADYSGARLAIAQNKNADETTLGRLYDKSVADGDNMLSRKILGNSNVGSSTIRKAVRHPDVSVSSTAVDKLAYVDPDSVNTDIEYSNLHDGFSDIREVDSHPATEKLKHLKGLVQAAGGTIHKKELQGMGYGGAPGQILNHKGEVTPEGIDNYLKTLPHHKVGVSWDFWGGDRNNTTHQSGYNGLQRHDDTKTQRVLQVNFTNDQIHKMKEEGVFDLFRKVHDDAYSRSHPVRKHTMGWARIDDHKPGHWHIDEVQSDIWSQIMTRAHRAKQNMDNHEEGTHHHTEAKKNMEGLKKLVKIIQGPYKNPNHTIIGAAHEVARQKGIETTSMDMPQDQFAQSGKRGNVDSAKFKFTYQQWPADNKYEEKPKKEIMPETKGVEPSVQFRKLVKSLNLMKFLLTKLEE